MHTAAFYPSFNISGTGGFQSDKIGDWLTWPSHFFSIGPSASYTIFDAGSRRAVLANYKAQYLYMVFHSVAESAVLIFPTLYALTGGLILQKFLGYNFSVAVWVAYIALFGIAVETGVVMVVYLHEALKRRLASGEPVSHQDIEEGVAAWMVPGPELYIAVPA